MYDDYNGVTVDANGQLMSNGKMVGKLVAAPYTTISTTSTVITGACDYYGYVCTTAAGTITIYDGLSASGEVILPTTTLAVGSNILPVGVQLKLGCHVVLSGAAQIKLLASA